MRLAIGIGPSTAVGVVASVGAGAGWLVVGSVTAGSWFTTTARRFLRCCTTAVLFEGDTRAATTTGRLADDVDVAAAACAVVLVNVRGAGRGLLLALDSAAAVTPPPTASTATVLAAMAPNLRSIFMAGTVRPTADVVKIE